MKNIFFSSLLLSSALLLAAPMAHAADSASSSNITLDADTVISLDVKSALTLAPTSTDYLNNQIEKTGANGITVTITSNSSTGATVNVHGTPGASLPSANIALRNGADKGGGTYLTLSDTDQQIYTQTTAMLVNAPVNFNLDVKISPLQGFGDQEYTNSLTFTATTNPGVVPPR